ncbi:MAG: M48 family metallopeptidase [Oscillospiraceae bacterium]|jgi:predicted metal-dependent hydrolase|nr:M48 family metallopeptidase [Oscillospiraceae bacterium]
MERADPLRMIDFTLVRSNRKTVAIYIRPDATVEVRAPRATPRREIDRFVAAKEAWITQKLALMQTKQTQRTAFCPAYGSTVLYCGREHPIAAKPGRRVGFDGTFFMPPGLEAEQIKAACVQIYRLLAKQLLREKAQHFAALMDVSPADVKITGAKTRWGSCSARGNINFSWRLVMAAEDTIDYVVVHELAHLRELNHSERFWRIVAGVLPEYPARRAELRVLQQRLGGEEWE